MDPAEVLNVRFHYGGEFIRIGPSLDYVGGDTALSEIQRDKLSLPELRGFLGDHLTVKESMKLYFLMPGREMVNGLVFLYTDEGCLQMSEYITDEGLLMFLWSTMVSKMNQREKIVALILKKMS
jgi:hypothetical protein